MEDLTPEDPQTHTEAYAIEPGGQAVGEYFDASGNTHAAAFVDGQVQKLGIATISQATGISSGGMIVGNMRVRERDHWTTHAFRWESGAAQDLGTLGGTVAEAFGIGDSGRIVGASRLGVPGRGVHAFQWEDGVMGDIGTLDGGGETVALAISGNGLIVGAAALKDKLHSRAFLWRDGQMTDLGIVEPGLDTYARAVNRNGVVVGDGENGRSYYAAPARWTKEGGWENLGLLGLGAWGYATGVNDEGTVVGCSETDYGGLERAFVVPPGQHHVVDLNSRLDPKTGAGWTLFCATAINGSGQIVGYGSITSGYVHAFRLTPMR